MERVAVTRNLPRVCWWAMVLGSTNFGNLGKERFFLREKCGRG